MPVMPVKLRPGPRRIAAALKLAGFAEDVLYPDYTDALGRVWKSPSALLIMGAVVGGESSGHVWVYRRNTDGSTDYGMAEINDTYNKELFQVAYPSPTDANWAAHADNARMAKHVYEQAMLARKTRKGPAMDDFKPWHATAGIGKVRWQGDASKGIPPHTWLDWAQSGIDDLHAAVAANPAQPLEFFASIDLDPLQLGRHPLIY